MKSKSLSEGEKPEGGLNSPFYTVSALAEYLQLNPMTIYRLVKAGELPYYSLGRVMRFRRNEIEQYLQGVRVPSRSGRV
jgi:excisionase family DNA binding protein